jgi:hypothetical protein
MTFADYAAIRAVNWSSLCHMVDSAAHYRYHRDHEAPETPQQTIGRYVHAAVLDPAHLADEFAVWDGDRRDKDYKAFAAANAEKTILRAAELEDAHGMIDVLRHHRGVQDLLTGAATEYTIQWTDPTTGLPCKARLDLHKPGLLADLKTTRSVEIRRFGADIARYLYHGQMAHYAAGIEATTGAAPRQVTLIAVESKPPYDVAIFPLSAESVAVGLDLRDGLLYRLKECMDTNTWPGRYPAPVELNNTNLPPWIFGGGLPEFEFEETP